MQNVLPHCLSIKIKCHFPNNFCKVLISDPFDHNYHQKKMIQLFQSTVAFFWQSATGTLLDHLEPDSAKSSGVELRTSLNASYQSIGYYSLTFTELPKIAFMWNENTVGFYTVH